MSGAMARGVVILAALMLLPSVILAQGKAEKGKALYTQYCAACHGATGKGDGPGAAALNPKPRDLTDKPYMAGLKDEYLFAIVAKGGAAVGKSPLMPPWGAALKDEGIREVIAYVRSLSKK
ncbi:MAG: c-type cytochrome [Nitrospinota bacterium]